MSDEETETRDEGTVEEQSETGKTEETTATGLTEDEVNKRIEKARKQEKDKLYDTINVLKQQIQDLTDLQKADREAKDKLEKEKKDQVEKEKRASMTAEEKMQETLRSIEEQLARETKAREKLEVEAKEERKLRGLEQYRAEVLRQAGDKIIPELVTGDTKEEIERNAALAKNRYQDIFDASYEKAKGTTGKMPKPTDPDPAAMEEADLQKSIANFEVDTDRYFGNKAKDVAKDHKYVAEVKQKREELVSSLAKAYQRNLTQ